jgi:hypothetical protein
MESVMSKEEMIASANITFVIEKAMIACEQSGKSVADHFIDISKMVDLQTSASNVFCERELSLKTKVQKMHITNFDR